MDAHESLHAAIHEKVKLHDYDPSWPAAFLAERERLHSLFPGQFVELAHIGSTAIPGLKAKPIIDILAGVESMAVAEALTEPLCRSGYTTSAEFNETL
ncbi:MAG: GrpB family protein, partial [Ramlibacter sp.]